MSEGNPTEVRNAAELAGSNDAFRRTIVTGEHQQLVVMTIEPGGEIGEETHEDGDQILSFTTGAGEAVIERESSPVRAGDVIFVPAGTLHNFVNTGEEPLRLLTMYAPPEHPAGTVHETKEDADADEHNH